MSNKINDEILENGGNIEEMPEPDLDAIEEAEHERKQEMQEEKEHEERDDSRDEAEQNDLNIDQWKEERLCK